MIPIPENTFLVLYDGDCLLCHASVRIILHNDVHKKFYFAPLNSPTGQEIRNHLGIASQGKSSIIVYIPNSTYYSKSQAIVAIAKHLKAPYSWVRYIRYLPKPFSDWVYDCIASNRYKWFGTSTTCYIPDAEESQRFIG